MGVQFRLIWSRKAEDQISKLDFETRDRIVNKLEKACKAPFQFIKKLEASPFHSLRVGKYRLILSIRTNALIIFVVRVSHRKNIYQN